MIERASSLEVQESRRSHVRPAWAVREVLQTTIGTESMSERNRGQKRKSPAGAFDYEPHKRPRYGYSHDSMHNSSNPRLQSSATHLQPPRGASQGASGFTSSWHTPSASTANLSRAYRPDYSITTQLVPSQSSVDGIIIRDRAREDLLAGRAPTRPNYPMSPLVFQNICPCSLTGHSCKVRNGCRRTKICRVSCPLCFRSLC